MYTVYSDDLLIHSQHSPSKEVHLINPVLKMAENTAGSFEFTIPPDHVGYNEIHELTSTIVVKRETRCIWTGRVVQIKENFWNQKIFTCEGALAFLNDTYQPSIDYSNTNLSLFFRSVILEHNKKKVYEPDRQFTVGAITIGNDNETFDYYTDYENTWDLIKTVFLDQFGGHLIITYNNNSITPVLNYMKDYPVTAAQTIDFGKNLEDFTKEKSLLDVHTVLIPVGQIRVSDA